MRIGFRRIAFTEDERRRIEAIAVEGGLKPVWLDDDAHLTPEAAAQYEVLMGFFPVEETRLATNLKWLQIPSAGAEAYCGDCFANPDVVLTNGSGAYGGSIAEQMVCGFLMLMRHFHEYRGRQRTHTWGRTGENRTINGSSFCIVGTGNIGSELARRLRQLGASQIHGVNRSGRRPTDDYDINYTIDQLAEAVADVDGVALVLPGTPETRGIVDAKVLAAMDKRTILINCGRGYTVDEAALAQALASKQIYGAQLDVFEVEPLPAESPLWDLENVIITPHTAGGDDDPVNSRVIYTICEKNLRHYLAGEPLEHVVDRAKGY